LAGLRTSAFERLAPDGIIDPHPHIHGGEQSNTSARFDNQFIMKMFRRVTAGVNPDLEIGRQLTEHHPLANVPDVAGAIEYRTASGQPMTVAVLHEFVPSVGDGWTYTMEELGRYFERVLTRSWDPGMAANTATASSVTGAAPSPAEIPGPTPVALPHIEPTRIDQYATDLNVHGTLLELANEAPPTLAQETVGAYLHTAELLGSRTADLHVALSNIRETPAFAPEPFTRLYQRSLYQSMRSQARTTLDLLRSQRRKLNDAAGELADRLIEQDSAVLARFSRLLQMRIDALRIRCHGDYHLGQTLFTGKDWVIIDFEGEPERPVSERRIKASPLRDVAGMIRSLHYVSNAAILGQAPTVLSGHSQPLTPEQWATYWYNWTAASFLRGYREGVKQAGIMPEDETQMRTLLESYLLEKALYELRYELNNRPDWVRIPLEGILQLLE
jgi:maltose alpha-D-glucosyltransferase/alpha-amylase